MYQDEVERLVGTVPALLADLSPLEALRRWTTDFVEAMRRKHRLGDALSPSAHQAVTAQTYDPVVAAIRQILAAGQRDGSIREDADPGDFLQLTAALWRATPGPHDRAPRMLALILGGLRAQSQ